MLDPSILLERLLEFLLDLSDSLRSSPSYILCLVGLCYGIYARCLRGSTFPLDLELKKSIPVIGTPNKFSWIVPGIRTRFESWRSSHIWVQDGYERYSRSGLAFILRLWDGDVTFLPSRYLDEVKNASDSDLIDTVGPSLMLDWTMNPLIAKNPYHVKMIKRDVTSKLNTWTPLMVKEMGLAMDRYFTEYATTPEAYGGWQKVPMFKVLLKAIAQTSSRVFVGEEICREERYLDAVTNFATLVLPTAAVLKIVPYWLRFLLAPVITMPMRRQFKVAHGFLKPVIEKRAANLRKGIVVEAEPNDLLQMIIREAPLYGKEEANPHAISMRLLAINFAAIHTVAILCTDCIYDMATLSATAQPGSNTVTEKLRDEVLSVFPSPDSIVKRSLPKLSMLDAFVKESARLRLAGGLGMIRVVSNPNGWATSDGNLWFPKNSLVGFPSRPMHLDGCTYKDPMRHDWTRFHRYQEQSAEMNVDKTIEKLASQDQHIVSASNDFFVFGVGKHACPGRFFAASEAKILLTTFLLRYDLRPIDIRPTSTWFGLNNVPDMDYLVQISRRGGKA